MFKPILIYCYDAYCGWCYGFSSVMRQLDEKFGQHVQIEVLSGGMVLPEKPTHISATAEYILGAYKNVETTTGVVFGNEYLWHLENPNDTDWFPNSEKPAVAMCIIKEHAPEKQVAFAADLQYAHFFEGRDLTDNESYRHLANKYGMDDSLFVTKLNDPLYLEKAHYEFQLCKQLQVTGFPTLLLQTGETKFYLLARGYANYDTVYARLQEVVKEIAPKQS